MTSNTYGYNIKGYIFDYGGTLDTGGNHWGRMIWHAYQHCSVPVDEELFREAYVYAERELGRNPIIQPDYTFLRTLDAKLRIEMEYIATKLNGFNPGDWHQAVLDRLYSGVKAETAHSRKVLLRLKDRCPMVLVSNFYGNINTVLHEFSLDGIFNTVVESAVVGVRKPDPRIFTLGVEALDMEPDMVTVVGDSYDKDIVPAKLAGCHTVWMKGEGWTNDTPDGKQANRIIHSLEELVDNGGEMIAREEQDN